MYFPRIGGRFWVWVLGEKMSLLQPKTSLVLCTKKIIGTDWVNLKYFTCQYFPLCQPIFFLTTLCGCRRRQYIFHEKQDIFFIHVLFFPVHEPDQIKTEILIKQGCIKITFTLKFVLWIIFFRQLDCSDRDNLNNMNEIIRPQSQAMLCLVKIDKTSFIFNSQPKSLTSVCLPN